MKVIKQTLLLVFVGTSFSLANFTLFQEANNYYKNGQYKESLSLYEKILRQGFTNAELYFNAGNSSLKLFRPANQGESAEGGYLGKAVLYFKKAALINPSDKEISYNLKFVLKMSGNSEQEGENQLLHSLLFFYYLPSVKALTFLTLAIFLLFSLMIAAYFLIRGSYSKKFALGATIAFFLWAILFPTTLVKYNKIYLSKEAVVLSSRTPFLKEPIRGSEAVSTHGLGEGMIVTIEKYYDEKTMNPWAFVSLPNGVSGWVPLSAIAKVSI